MGSSFTRHGSPDEKPRVPPTGLFFYLHARRSPSLAHDPGLLCFAAGEAMEALTQKLDTLSFAVAGAIYGAA